MKFLCLGDVHLRSSTPKNRCDNLFETQFNKMKHILEYAIDNEISYILQPGDLFDKHNCPYEVTERYIDLFNSFTTPVPILCCLGQHDQRYHKQSTKNTPIGCLFAGIRQTGSKLLASEPFEVVEPYTKSKVHIYGSSWGEEIPTIQDQNAFNILVTHRMVTKDGPLWQGQIGNIEAKELIRQTKFRLIVSGDNHQSFKQEHRMRYLVNCGSLMRTGLDQIDHEPCFYVYDTQDHGKLEYHKIPIENNVFAFDKVVEEKKTKKELEEFVQSLARVRTTKLSFKGNLRAYVEGRHGIEDEVISVVNEVMEGM